MKESVKPTNFCVVVSGVGHFEIRTFRTLEYLSSCKTPVSVWSSIIFKYWLKILRYWLLEKYYSNFVNLKNWQRFSILTVEDLKNHNKSYFLPLCVVSDSWSPMLQINPYLSLIMIAAHSIQKQKWAYIIRVDAMWASPHQISVIQFERNLEVLSLVCRL